MLTPKTNTPKRKYVKPTAVIVRRTTDNENA